MTTLSNWEEEGMVEDILVKIESLDQFAPELTSSLKNGMKDLKEATILVLPTNQVPLVLDTQHSPQAKRAGPAAPAADALALLKEPEDVEMAVGMAAKPSFAAVVDQPQAQNASSQYTAKKPLAG
ncbi:hypothetical protein IWW35_000559 [Coemansia sp. RSA 1878]|nr:hypothetical protein IWW35_000559 [Coemansia sp. RSA 1878]